MTKNTSSTRYYSNNHEESVCKALNASKQPNSGASKFNKGDCINKKASLLIECKTCMKDKDSFSIKKEWVEKNKQESFSQRTDYQCIAFNFGPNQSNYYVINERLMKMLVEKLEEDNEKGF